MALHTNNSGGASALPLNLLSQAILLLNRHELAALTERLIERLDLIDGDADLEDSDEDCAVDDCGCDDAEQGDAEEDFARMLPAPIYGTDQRLVMNKTPFGKVVAFRHD